MATWRKIEGTPEQKVEAIKNSKAFCIVYGFRPPVQHSVRVVGDTIHWVETDEGEHVSMSAEELVERLEELGNPPVEVSHDY